MRMIVFWSVVSWHNAPDEARGKCGLAAFRGCCKQLISTFRSWLADLSFRSCAETLFQNRRGPQTPQGQIYGVTRVTSHPPSGAAAYFMRVT